ncbi:hypothetical protein F0562_031602 [Nyssa sinensis]|uniref:Protein RDM1 n=1 Tax=Nyssa sinensis TaxID=561372 RepID=A0A5J5ASX7_9ASTE|nr:hypothetical protein F0562_031602 [Nyssa sinensis]
MKVLRSYKSLKFNHRLVSDLETRSGDFNSNFSDQAQKKILKGITIKKKLKIRSLQARKKDSDGVIRHAKMYQDYMKRIQIPKAQDLDIHFNTWQELAYSLKHMYGQPLHYLTRIKLMQWDRSRIGTENEHKPTYNMTHPSKAEATIWVMEEIHRRTTSHYHLAQLWLAHPMYHVFIDPIVSQS